MANAWELYKQKNGGIAYRSDSAQEIKTSSKAKEETEEVKEESQQSAKVKTMTQAKQEAQEKAGKSQENSIYQYTDSGTGGKSTNTAKKPNPLDVISIQQELEIPQLNVEKSLSTDVMNSILTNIMERNKRASMLSEIEFIRNPQFSEKYGNDYENYLNNKPQKAIGFGSDGTTYVDEADADKYSFGGNVRPAARKESILTATGKSVLAGMEGFNASVASAGEALARGLMSVERAVSGTDAFTGSLFKPVLDLSESRKEQKQALQEQAQESWSGHGKAGAVANELIQGVTGAVPNAVLAIMSGGTSTASTLGPQATGMLDIARNAVTRISQNPLYWSSFVPSFGSGFAEAKGQGATDEQAFMAAALSATANSVIEQSGGIETMPDDLSKMTAPKKALDVVKTALDEGKEELFQNPIERLVNKAVIGTDNPYFSVTDENAVLNPVTSAKEFAMGATVGGLMRGGQTLFQSAINAGTRPESQTSVREASQGAQRAVQENPQSYTADIGKAVSEAPTAQDAAILQTFAQGAANNEKVNIDNRGVSPEDSTGAAPYGFDPLSNAANQYGAIPPGTNAARVVDIPRQMDADTKVSYTARSAAEAQATPDSFVPIIENETVKGRFSYVPVTNDATTAKAVQNIEANGYQESLRDWTAKARAGIANEDTVATGALLYNNAVNAGDEKLALDILTDYQNLLRNAGRAVQAANILKKIAPQDRLYMIDKSVDKIIEKFDLPETVTISDDLKQEYLAAKTEKERNNVISKMQQEVADQIPPTLMDKWTALRYVNMLGNFKTQGRNLSGNVSQLILTIQKDGVAAAIESAVKLVNPNYEKTKSFFVPRELMRAASADFEDVRDIALGEAKFSDTDSTGFMKGVEEKRRIFKFAPLEAYRKATNWAMEQGDVIFSKATYARSLAGWLKAHGVTASQYTDEAWRAENRNTVESAQSYAIKQAQEATYRDSNAFSNWVSKIGRRKDTPWYGRLISEGIMPFRKTPANVLLRAEEYSPLGIVNTAVKAIQMARGSENVSGSDVVDSLAKTITGSGLLALGYGLSKGFLDDALEKLTDGAISSVKLVGKRDDEQDMLEGAQSYAIEVTDSDGTVHSYTIDWLSPSAIPMLMGAVMREEIEDNGFQLSDLEGALTSIADPLVQMSMLQGLNDTLGNIKYSENNLGQMVLNAGVSYLTQGLTNTLMGQIERTTEETRKTTYVDKDSEVPEWAQRLLGKASQKIPGWDYQQTDYIDAWGRTEPTGSIPQRAFSNFISPGYYSEINSTAVDDEIKRLEDITGNNLTPGTAQKYITVDGGKKFLDSDQYAAYATTKGQTDLATRNALLQNDIYKNVPDSVKAKAMALSAQYADALGKKAAGVGYSGEDAWISELDGKSESDVVRTIMEKAIDSVGIQNEPMARNLGRGIQQKKYSELPSEVTAQVQSYIDQYVKAEQKKEYGFEDASDWVEKARELDTDQARLDFFTNKAIGETGTKLAKDRTDTIVNGYNDARFTGLSDELKQKAAEYADNYFETTKRGQYGADVSDWMKDAEGLNDGQLADLFLSKAIENRTKNMPGNVYVNLNELYDNKEIGDDVLMTALAAGNETAFKKYTDYGEPAGLTPSEYIDLLNFANSDEAKSSKDEWGADIKGQTQKDKILAWIDKQNVSDEKKEAMRLCLYDDASAEMRMLSEKYKGKEMTENEVLRAVSASVRTKYLDVAIPAKIPLTTYLEASAFAGEATSDRDENGKEIKGRKKQDKIIAYIAALDIDNKMKRALYNCFYDSMKNCPW